MDANILLQMQDWARDAGNVLKRHFRQLKHIDEKRTIDLVTVADREAENVILQYIHQCYPEHYFLAV